MDSRKTYFANLNIPDNKRIKIDMDYKEKYEEAYKLYHSEETTKDQKYVLERLFHELAESEDEMIRKHLIKHFGNKSKEDWNGVPVKSILAWLEKQGENNMGISEATKQKLEDNLNNALEKETPESWNKFLDEQGEQKPADEVEPRQEELTEFERAVKQVMEEAIECGDIHNLKADADMLLRLTQKPTWGDEDESLCTEIQGMLGVCRIKELLSSNLYEKMCNWLKSLRPQNTWKPSEGQLECLGYAIDKAEKDYSPLVNNRIYLTLKALKEQLKKLKE